MRILLRTGMILLALASTSCASVLRTEPFIRGTIVNVGNGWLDVRHKSGRNVRVLTSATATAAGLRPNVRAFVRLEGSAQGPLVAREVRVLGAGNP